tara:strand:- start:5250 stop:5468 length:219 start_codon:yes stop_codon:yes gene_type:complete
LALSATIVPDWILSVIPFIVVVPDIFLKLPPVPVKSISPAEVRSSPLFPNTFHHKIKSAPDAIVASPLNVAS